MRLAINQTVLVFVLLNGIEPTLGQDRRSTISGRVVDAASGRPLAGANVLLENTPLGAATDPTGAFLLLRVPRGNVLLVVQMLGYARYERRLTVSSENISVGTIALSAAAVETPEVLVEGEAWKERAIPSHVFQPSQTEQTPGTMQDVIRLVHYLPGVVAAGDFSNQLIVRGGSPDQNLIIMDDVEVFNPYRRNALASMFNPAMVQDIRLMPGGFPAQFGDRLSSVLIVNTREGRRDAWLSGRADVGMTNASALLEGKTALWGGSWLVGARRTYFDFFKRLTGTKNLPLNQIVFPDFEDVQAKLTLYPTPDDRLTVTGLASNDLMERQLKEQLGEQESGSNDLNVDNRTSHRLAGISWTHTFSARTHLRSYANAYRSRGTSSFSGGLIPNDEYVDSGPGLSPPPRQPSFADGDTISFRYNENYVFRKYSVGGALLSAVGPHTLEFGAGIDLLHTTLFAHLRTNEFGSAVFDALQDAPNWFGAIADSVDRTLTHSRWHLFLQDRWELLDGRLLLHPGLRFDYLASTSSGFLSPRLAAAIKLNAVTTFRLAGGMYRQSPGYEKVLEGEAAFGVAHYGRLEGLVPEEALHLVSGIDRRLSDTWLVKVEAYWKRMDRLIVQASEPAVRPSAVFVPSRGFPRTSPDAYNIVQQQDFILLPRPVNDATGRAYGVELLVEKRRSGPDDRLGGWLAYSYSKATRQQMLRGQRVEFPFDYDRRHSVNVVAGYRVGANREWEFGVTWKYGTGFPFTPALGVEPLIASLKHPEREDSTIYTILVEQETGEVRFVPDFGGTLNFQSGRLPDYHRLDLRLSYTATISGVSAEVYLDVINAYRRKNVLYYRNIIVIEDDTRDIPPSLRRPRGPVLYFEPVYMFPRMVIAGISARF
jgi:hypothetical protein